MKKIIFLVGLCACTMAAQAQTDPLDQYLLKTYFPSLVAYDSITLSQDTGANFMAMETASMYYMHQDNSRIDTAVVTNMGSVYATYKGEFKARSFEISGFDPMMGTDTAIKYIFHKDLSGNDSLIELYVHNGMELALNGAFAFTYNSGSQVQNMHFIFDASGMGSFDTLVTYTYMYNSQARLDSVLMQVNFMGVAHSAKSELIYSGSKLMSMETYEDTSSTGTPAYELVMVDKCMHNSQDEIVEIHSYSVTSGMLSLEGAVRYSTRTNSSIGLAENRHVQFDLYPNPAEYFLRISTDKNTGAYEIISVSGQLVKKGKLQDNRIDIRNLEAGSYLLRLEVGGNYEALPFQKK